MTQQRSFRERILDPKNRRSKNIEDRRAESQRLNVNRPIPLPVDFSTVSPHQAKVARYQSEDAKTGAQTDETPPTVRVKKKRGLRNVRLGR